MARTAAQDLACGPEWRFPCHAGFVAFWVLAAVARVGVWRWQAMLLFVVLAALGQDRKPESEAPFRIGFSSATFGEVNENDAIAAVRVWSQSLARERGIPADPQPKILRNFTEIQAALTDGVVDCLNLTTEEYAALRKHVVLEDFVVAVKGRSITEEYVLLVHRASGVEKLADLRGRKCALLLSSRASLVPAWLETSLAKESLGSAASFFGSITPMPKTTKAVLPVFFRQLDACVVTRSGFELMVELNPQVGQQLKALATSVPVVPVVFCFRGDYNSPVRKRILDELIRWHTVPAGRQILNLFQSDSLEQQPASCLQSALEMLETHQRLCGGTNSRQGGVLGPALDHASGGAK